MALILRELRQEDGVEKGDELGEGQRKLWEEAGYPAQDRAGAATGTLRCRFPARPPAFRRCPSTSATVSAVATTALPQAPAQRRSPQPAASRRNPTPLRRRFLALPEGFPRFFHFRAP